MCMCVCVCVCVYGKERKRERGGQEVGRSYVYYCTLTKLSWLLGRFHPDHAQSKYLCVQTTSTTVGRIQDWLSSTKVWRLFSYFPSFFVFFFINDNYFNRGNKLIFFLLLLWPLLEVTVWRQNTAEWNQRKLSRSTFFVKVIRTTEKEITGFRHKNNYRFEIRGSFNK